jgi:hypothetical protein
MADRPGAGLSPWLRTGSTPFDKFRRALLEDLLLLVDDRLREQPEQRGVT